MIDLKLDVNELARPKSVMRQLTYNERLVMLKENVDLLKNLSNWFKHSGKYNWEKASSSMNYWKKSYD